MEDPPPEYVPSSPLDVDPSGSVKVESDAKTLPPEENKAPAPGTTYGGPARKAGCCSGCRKVGLLIYKNFLVRRRHYCVCCCEIAFPLILFVLIAAPFASFYYTLGEGASGGRSDGGGYSGGSSSYAEGRRGISFGRGRQGTSPSTCNLMGGCSCPGTEKEENRYGRGRSGSTKTQSSVVKDCETKSFMVRE